MPNPKLEFFRFELKHKSDNKKTFRQFMLENGKATVRQKDNTIFGNLFKYFMEKPAKGFERNDGLQKVVTLIGNKGRKKINKHFNERPKVKFPGYIISGVINGGPFGKDRILSNLEKKDKSETILSTQPVLQYYYIFLYLPLDYHEGFVMVHSDSSEETITQALRSYIAELFKIGDYNKPNMRVYVPKYFRDEYKDGAILTSMTFVNTEMSADLEDDDPIKDVISEYEVRITLTPKGEAHADMSLLEKLKNRFGRNRFGTQEFSHGLDEYQKCTINTKNAEANSTKTFDWNCREQELSPTVFLKDRVAIGDDGTPIFSDLDKFCHKLFNDEILPEIRPDLYVGRVD